MNHNVISNEELLRIVQEEIVRYGEYMDKQQGFNLEEEVGDSDNYLWYVKHHLPNVFRTSEAAPIITRDEF